ncbi:hypothetical protein C7S20_16540 [Christiangramia fulva]|uniref:Outer membrane protein beta-barrel domain-containing protein n=1 Tax=Christiangramia fulva TaxID=2126553 RepID=A0A2R3ZB61_9FLAO|nr:DUF6048 family protein [Christiangramia fulva]AVR47516.1 hypothetical protein C7S20_16540 [Christiangramia fulva]
MYRYFSKLLLLLFFSFTSVQAQNEQLSDSLQYKDKYGLRVGIDISKALRTFLEDGYSGLELVGDYRVSEKFYAAAELGNEKLTFEGDNIGTTANGSYIKIGADYNAYDNWQDMQNIIFVGLRYGFSTFSQTLDWYRVYSSSAYYGPDVRMVNNEVSGLNASWIEMMIGIKVELFNNLFLSANVQLKRRIAQKTPDNFDNLAIPGFGRTYDESMFGAGYGYTISYLIPLYKKNRH